jgi:hypothetical protein
MMEDDSGIMTVALTKEHEQLFKFYNVDNYYDLVDIQSNQIDRLQKRLPPLSDSCPRRAREG